MRILIPFALSLLLACPVLAGQTLTFGMGDDDTRPATSILTILQTAYSRIGIDVQGKPLPAVRALVDADMGYVDGELCRIAAIESQHPNLVRIPVPVMKIEIMAYTKDSTPSINRLEDLETRRIGIKAGLRFAEIHTQNMPNVLRRTNHESLFKLLAADRLDVVIATRSIPHGQWGQYSAKTFYIHEPPLAELELFHYLHKKHAALVPIITKELSRMYESGEMDTIRNAAKTP